MAPEIGPLNSETVALLRAVLDQLWRALPSPRRTFKNKVAMAIAIMQLAMQGERNPRLLAIFASMAITIATSEGAAGFRSDDGPREGKGHSAH